MTVHQSLAEWSSWGWPLLANHLWQATLIALVAFAAARLLRKGPGRARYALWLIASAKFVLPSALALATANILGIDLSSLSASNDRPVDGATIIFQLAAPIVQVDESASVTHAAHGHNELFCALTVLWFSGIIALLAVWLRRRRRFRAAMRALPAADATRERRALDRVSSWLAIESDVRLSLLPGTLEPGVWGVWRPRIFLPERMAEELSDAELEAVIMHELIHIARWDNLIANLHRLVCCVLWFHPIVWMLDRLLLAERERACDDEVVRLGGAADVYASSLLKVLRFCLGWNLVGASNATGSNLGRRIERIMSKNVQVSLSIWHRAAIGSIAVLVIILSMAAGLLTRDGAMAQSGKPRDGVIGGVTGGVPGGVAGGVPGGVSGGVPGGVPGGVSGVVGVADGREQQKLLERLDQAPEMTVEFRNSAKAPLVITEAKVKAVPREEGQGDEFAVVPIVTLTNNTGRSIRGFSLEFRNGAERRAYYERVTPPFEPHAVYTCSGQKRFVILAGRPDAWTVRVGGVVYEDGEVWGVVPPPPPPPPPPPALTSDSDNTKVIRKSGGVLTESATHRVVPESPPLVRAARIAGSVVVEVMVDEMGAVISARAISGHPLLRDAAVDAARQWQFAPTMLSGVPVRVIGTLIFNFEP